MAFPHIRPVAAPDGPEQSPGPRWRSALGNGDGQPSIIGRRDVAVIPWITIAMVAIAVAISTALRPDGDLSDGLVIGGALAYAVFAGTLALLQDRPLMVRLAGSLPVYLLGSALLVSLLAGIGALDQGLATVFFAPVVQVAVYLGLILPTRWSRGAIVALLATVGAVQAINPVASTRDAVSMFGLVFAAWLVGALCHSAHGRAARIALMLSRSDVLTRSLNRRGFFDQFDAELASARASRSTVALLIADLDDFKKVNDERGHAAGDELLRWVGEAIPQVLPPKAALGRLGGDEFGILLPGASREVADAVAAAIVAALKPKIGASIGVATSQDPDTTADDYLRVADAALYACKSTAGLQVQSLVAGSTRALDAAQRTPRAPDLTYAQLSAAGGPPDRPAQGIHYGWLLRGGFWIIAAAGALIIAGIAIEGPANAWGEAILWIGAPWVALNVALGALNYGDADIEGRRVLIARIASSMLVGAGIAAAML
ncbi:MAG: GGDEF domain-containing protein, partial [Solirubrobacteraceae bacterium]|nr:GGDEF domain-containing protein [Solirubrobacteraceae bacterium]